MVGSLGRFEQSWHNDIGCHVQKWLSEITLPMVVFECITICAPTVSLQQILRTLQYDAAIVYLSMN